MYNWPFNLFMLGNVLSAYLSFGERLDYQINLMMLFRGYGAFEGKEKELGFMERSTLEKIAEEELVCKCFEEMGSRLGRK